VDNLKSITIQAFSWNFLEFIGVQGVRFVFGIVLARLLFPDQYGQIGMLTIFLAVAQTFLDGGFGAALIQKHEATEADICSIFYFNIAIGLAVAGFLCLIAPWIATFYNQPILIPLTRLMSLIIIFNSLALIHTIILQKEINFKTLTKVSLIASLLSGIIGVIIAVAGYGVWSLVIQQIANAIFQALFLWLMNSWRPALIFSIESIKQMFSFGSRMLASGLLNQIFNNIYLVVIGKLFSATELGYFTRAMTLQEFPSNLFSGVVGRVTFPVFSTIQNDFARIKRGLKKALTILVLVTFPMMIGLAIIARPLVLVLLTDKWAGCIPYLQLLSVYGLLIPLHLINLNLLQTLGRSEIYLRLEIVKKIFIIISIAITWRWGISAMIYGLITSSIICYYLNSYYTGIQIDYPFWEQLRDLFPYLTMASIMGIAVFAVGFIPFPSDLAMLLIQITIGLIIYVTLCWLFRLKVFMEIWEGGLNRLILYRSKL
jgi:teichuronic acid exporter